MLPPRFFFIRMIQVKFFSAIICALIVGSYSIVLAQEKCAAELANAQQEYVAGNFDKALGQVGECLKKTSLSRVEKTRALELLALIHLSKQNRALAKYVVETLIKVNPAYVPDPSQLKPDYIKLVKEVKKENPSRIELPRRGGGKKWLWIGVGTAAVGGGVIYVLTRPPLPEKLPDPPGGPTRK